MYEVKRKDGKIIIYDWNDKVVYNVKDASVVVYRNTAGEIVVAEAGTLTDVQLLTALANAAKLAL